MDDISAEVEDEKFFDVICRLVSCGGKKSIVCGKLLTAVDELKVSYRGT